MSVHPLDRLIDEAEAQEPTPKVVKAFIVRPAATTEKAPELMTEQDAISKAKAEATPDRPMMVLKCYAKVEIPLPEAKVTKL